MNASVNRLSYVLARKINNLKQKWLESNDI